MPGKYTISFIKGNREDTVAHSIPLSQWSYFLWSAKQREGALSRNAPDIGSIFVVENYAFNPELNLVPGLQSRAVCKVEIILQENK